MQQAFEIFRYPERLAEFARSPLPEKWLQNLPALIQDKLSDKRNRELIEWCEILQALPNATPEQKYAFMLRLSPWRKGPFDLPHVFIDSEWQCQMKWSRVQKHLPSLKYKNILDVGCGNGYYLAQMHKADARWLVGVEPHLRFHTQWQAVQNDLQTPRALMLPCTLEELLETQSEISSEIFDLVFSMGVLYHRRSPIDHLTQLKQCLKPGGELILETLVTTQQDLIMPEDRYAKMRNVWFIPSVPLLVTWLRRCGWIDIEVWDVSVTSFEEQRRTKWMTAESLVDFLNADQNKTLEGYEPPTRALIKARRG